MDIFTEIYMKVSILHLNYVIQGCVNQTSPNLSQSWSYVTLKMEVKDLGASSLFLLKTNGIPLL